MKRIPAPAPPAPRGYVPARHSGEGNGPITRVVVHSAVMECRPGAARLLADWCADGTTGGSWHYATDPLETIQCAGDRFVCWHAPPNPGSIGIEMADYPRPWPTTRTKAALAAFRRSWRWAKPSQLAMLRRTAELTAHLCLANDLPVRYLTPADLRAGKKGWTTHANVSAAFGQSTHWDPGAWPRRLFARWATAHAVRLLSADPRKATP